MRRPLLSVLVLVSLAVCLVILLRPDGGRALPTPSDVSGVQKLSAVESKDERPLAAHAVIPVRPPDLDAGVFRQTPTGPPQQGMSSPGFESRASVLPTVLPQSPEIDEALMELFPDQPLKFRRQEVEYTLRFNAFISECIESAGVRPVGSVTYWWHGEFLSDEEAQFTALERIDGDLKASDEEAWQKCAEDFHRENTVYLPGYSMQRSGSIHWVKKTVFPVRDHWLYRFIETNGQTTQ